MKMSSGMRRPRFLEPFSNFDAGRILPRALPVMSGTRHSTSSMRPLERNSSKLVKDMIDLEAVDRSGRETRRAIVARLTAGENELRTMNYAGRPSPLDARSYYRATAAPYPPLPPLEGESRVDVAVIGAGLTGLTAALELAERGFSVAVVD